MKRVQDPVHGLMEFRGMESFAIDALRTPELQRLRRIRQLGMAQLVFPGAEHSRFTHVLGAAHLASRFADSLLADAHLHLPRSLQPNESIVRDLVAAALCHDLGHGPLSHAWESNVVGELDERKRHAWTASLGLGDHAWISTVRRWHELVTQALLLTPGPLHDLLESVERGMSERVAALLGGRFYLPYLTRLLASDVDVDRCDFILRDAHQSGVAYGRYDLNWLVSTITVGTDPASGAPCGQNLHLWRKPGGQSLLQALQEARRLDRGAWHRARSGMSSRAQGAGKSWAKVCPEAPLSEKEKPRFRGFLHSGGRI